MASDNILLARLKEVGYVSASAAAVVTNPASTYTSIRLIILHNNNSTTETVNIWVVPDSSGAVGTAGDANKMTSIDILPGETVQLDFPAPGIYLTSTNDTLQMATTTASKVTVQVYGFTES